MLGWLTPDADEFTGFQAERTIALPGNLLFYITGALAQLSDSSNWEKFGSATIDETVEFFAAVLDEFLMSDMRNVGMIAPFVRSVAIPARWLELIGQTIAQADYPELTAVVPNSWKSGSDIILPNLNNAFLAGSTGSVIVGTFSGSNVHTLTTNELPAHTHTEQGNAAQISVAAPGEATAVSGISSLISGSTGGGAAHNNMPRYLAIRWALYAGR